MNERTQGMIQPDQLQNNINAAMWFFRALDTCMAISDPHLRSRAINEVVEAQRMCRPQSANLPDLAFLQEQQEQGQAVRRRS